MKKYSRRIVRFYSNKLNLLLLIPIVLFLVVSVSFRYFLEDQSKTSLKEQTLLREQVITRSGAKSIESFLKLAGNSIVLLAKDRHLIDISIDERTQTDLDDFISDWETTPIIGISLSDKDGIIQLISGRAEAVEPETSVADRDYFVWAKSAKKGEVFVGEPILPRGISDPQFILPLATPVYQDGEFAGVLGAAVLLPELTKTYLEPLHISQGTQVYLASLNGVILHSPYPKLIGVDIINHLQKNPFPGSEAVVKMVEERLHKAEEGMVELAWPNLNNRTDFTTYLLAYSPVRFDSQAWLLAVATPVEDTLAFYEPYRILKTVSFFIVLLSVVFFSAFIVLAIRITQKNAFWDGFNHGKNHHNEKRKRE